MKFLTTQEQRVLAIVLLLEGFAETSPTVGLI